MNKNGKYINTTFWPVAVFVCSLFSAIFLFSAPAETVLAVETVDFGKEVRVENNPDGGYKYYNIDNRDNVSVSSKLSDLLNRPGNFFFGPSFKTDERLQLTVESDADKGITFSGSITYTGTDSPFITLRGGTLKFNGLSLHSTVKALHMESGQFTQETGTIMVEGKSGSSSVPAVMTMSGGKADINGNLIYESENFGRGLVVDGDSAQAIIREKASISAGSAVLCKTSWKEKNSETRKPGLIVCGGRLIADKPLGFNTSSGFAVHLISAHSQAEIKGGEIRGNGGVAMLAAGEQDSKVFCNGGKFVGKIKLNRKSPSEVEIGGRTVKTIACADVFIEVPEQPEQPSIEAAPSKIYDFVEWRSSAEFVSTENPCNLSNFAEKADITPVITRKKVKFIVGDRSAETYWIPDGKIEFYVETYSGLVPQNYEITGWKEDGNDFNHGADKVEARVYTAIIAIKNPTSISLEQKYVSVFDAKERVVVSPKLYIDGEETLDGDGKYVYRWYKENDSVPCSTTKNLTVKNVSDSGTYTFKVGRSLDSMSQKSTEIEISKASYSEDEVPKVPPIEGVEYSPNKNLTSYDLPPGFAWKNSDECPVCNKTEYEVIYNADKDNYNDFFTNLTVNLQKSAYTEQHVNEKKRDIPLAKDVKYTGGPLSSYSSCLPEGFRWKEPAIIPTCLDNGKAYEVFYNEDPTNYEDYLTKIQLLLNKGVPVGEGLYLNISYKEGLTFETVISKLPASYRYSGTKPGSDPLAAGEFTYKATYNPDPNNYNDLETEFKVTVEKADPVVVTPPAAVPDLVYDGTEKALITAGKAEGGEIRYSLDNATYSTDIPKACAAGTYEVRFEVIGYVNYKDIPPKTISAVISPKTVEPNVTIDEETFVYAGEEIRPSVEVKIGNEIIPDTEYTIIYENNKNAGTTALIKVEDKAGGNYAFNAVSKRFTIEKATYDMSGVEFEDKTVTYNGREQTIEISGTLPAGVSVTYENNALTNAGQVTAYAYFTGDENYNDIDYMTAELTVERARSVIAGEARQSRLYDGTPKEIVFEIKNSEQIALSVKYGDSAFAPSEAGTYNVVVTTAESDNYLAGERKFVLNINENCREVKEAETADGEIGLSGFVFNDDFGVDNDSEISFKMENIAENGFELVVEMSDFTDIEGNYRVSVCLPKKWRGKNYEAVFVGANGTEVPVIARAEEKYLSLDVSGPGRVKLVEIISEKKKPLPWWAWLLISAGAVISCGGAAFAVIALKAKRRAKAR